jgi:hypothetical protein
VPNREKTSKSCFNSYQQRFCMMMTVEALIMPYHEWPDKSIDINVLCSSGRTSEMIKVDNDTKQMFPYFLIFTAIRTALGSDFQFFGGRTHWNFIT